MARVTYSIVLDKYRRQINNLVAELNSLEAERAQCRTNGDYDRISSRIEITLDELKMAARYLGNNAQWHLNCAQRKSRPREFPAGRHKGSSARGSSHRVGTKEVPPGGVPTG